jgi:hypothetical protein
MADPVDQLARGKTAQEGESSVASSKHVFEATWRAKWLADGSKTIDEMVKALEAEAAHLRELAAAGVELADVVEDDYAFLTTDDSDVATKYGFEPAGNEEEEYSPATVVGINTLGTGLATDLIGFWAVDGQIGILGHADSIEFVRPDLAKRVINARKAVSA